MSLRRTLAVGAAVAGVLVLGVSASAVGYKAGTVTSADIKDGNVRSNDIKDGGVYSSDLRDGTIRLADLAPYLEKQLTGGAACLPGTEVEYAVNSGGTWTVAGGPFGAAQATITNDSARNGVLQLATYPKAGNAYADAGVIVKIGTVGSRFSDGTFEKPLVKGPHMGETAVNLYVDVNNDGKYFSFVEGVYQGLNGDQVLYSVDETTPKTALAAGTTDETMLWAWVGISGNESATAALTRFAGHDLALC
jgi:hypothetical protein